MIIATSSPKKWKIGAEIIKLYQKTDFSHILIIKDDLVFQASNGLVNCMYIDEFLLHNKITSVFEVSSESIDFEFVKKQLGKEYGTIQLINIATRILFDIRIFKKDDDQKFICSEFVGKALKLPWVDDFTTPSEIYDYLKGNQWQP